MSTNQNTVRNVLVETKYSDEIYSSSQTFDEALMVPLKKNVLGDIPGLSVDTAFGAVEIPKVKMDGDMENAQLNPYDLSRGFKVSPEPKDSTFLLRATIKEKDLKNLEKKVKSDRSIVGVFSDPYIEESSVEAKSEAEILASVPPIRPGSPPLGTDRHVAARIGVPWLHRRHMDGRGVYVAIVDTGINVAYLRSRGKRPILDVGRSWMARSGDIPGKLPVGHGTMVAYDTMIAAPKATLLDVALLRSTRPGGSVMSGLLSDAIRAYAHLCRIMQGPRRPGAFSSLVVNNSWGMFHDSWDFPRGHPGHYAGNPAHPFNRIVGVLAHAGADILFAAGNCGRESPDGRCQGVTNAGIYGANSHPQVITVAGVDVLKRRVGYSTSGPGKLSYLKPDISSYTHFRGSGVYAADGGTSAATPVVSGLVAAFRSRFPYNANDFRTSPAAVRNLLMRTAEDRGSIGFDLDFGWGIVDGHRLALLRGLSVTSPQEEAATNIDEVTEIDSMLDRIDGLDEIPLSPEDMDMPWKQRISAIPVQLKASWMQDQKFPRAEILTDYGNLDEYGIQAKTRAKESAEETDGMFRIETSQTGDELH